MSTVSVHIVTFNSQRFIERCLKGVFEQTFPVHRVIVIDNASKDATPGLLATQEGKIEVVYNDQNTGFAAAHNQALRISQEDYFLVLNPDVYLDRDYLQHVIDFMDKHENTGSATGLLFRPGEQGGIDSAGIGMTKSRRAFDRTSLRAGNSQFEPEEVLGVSGAAAVYRRRLSQDVSVQGQFFDESFFAYKEDVDLAWRSRLAGWRAYCVPRAKAEHARGWKNGERGQQSRYVRQLSYVNRYRMMLKNDHGPYLGRHALHLISYELASLVYILAREPFLLKTWPKLLADIRDLLAQRQTVLSMRKVPWEDVYYFFGSH